MNKITLNGREIELLFSVKATIAISERCDGDIANISEIMEKNTTNQNLELMCGILCDLANGAVTAHNANITLGLEEGEKRPEFPVEYFIAVVTADDFSKVTEAALETMGIGSEFTVPDNVKTEEKDIDLAEIEAEKNESKKS